jgi:hypothetical protein
LAVTLTLLATPALACRYSPPPPFEKVLLSASNVYVFTVDSLVIHKDDGYNGRAAGKIRVLKVLKGSRPGATYISYPVGWCGGMHLDVGNSYVVATSQTGRILQFAPGERSVLDLGSRLLPRNDESKDLYGILDQVNTALRTGKVPRGFPKDSDTARTSSWGTPPREIRYRPQR